MKKIILPFLLSLVLIINSAAAVSAIDNAEAAAQMLNKLDLFLGTSKGFELERGMTRAEAAAMLVRYFGAEDEANTGDFSHPFTDVPKWAEGYVGWLYEQGITNGISETKFGSSNYITARQYAILLSRAMADAEDYINPVIASLEEIERIDAAQGFTRADAVIFSANALSGMYLKGDGTMLLARRLLNLGVFTKSELVETAEAAIPPKYKADSDGTITRTLFDIELEALPVKYPGIFILHGDNDNIVAQMRNTSAMTMSIMLLDAHSGKIRDTYTAADDILPTEYSYEAPREIDEHDGEFFRGEAGLYRYDGKNLIQITDRAVNDMLITDDGYILLTHKPGKRVYGGLEGLGGNEILLLSLDGTVKYLTPEDMEIDISDMWMSDDALCFSQSTPVGMMNFDTYTYRIEQSGKITVTDFTAGRPEVMNGFTYDNPTEYKAEYIKTEQSRIDSLGY